MRKDRRADSNYRCLASFFVSNPIGATDVNFTSTPNGILVLVSFAACVLLLVDPEVVDVAASSPSPSPPASVVESPEPKNPFNLPAPRTRTSRNHNVKIKSIAPLFLFRDNSI